MIELKVDLGERSYPIYIGTDLIAKADDYLSDHIISSQVLIVSNETVAPLYLDSLKTALQRRIDQVEAVILPDGEEYKNLDIWNRIFDRLLELRFERRCTLIALGGGVIGDMTGFAAACYQRGVHFIQVPTTLLSQVDSSVGGKTGVNHRLGKNMIGAFYQPKAVLIDIHSLNTLPDRELAAGLAEVIKYGLINDADFFAWLEQHMDQLNQRDPEALSQAIARSCQDKAAIVAADEKEAGRRALLNLGHTFGHAIETGMGYGQWLHGEAVAAGMCMAARLSQKMGWLDQDQVARIEQLIKRAKLPTAPPAEIGVDRFLELMSVDKKVQSGKLRLILLRDIGQAVIEANFKADLLRDTIAAYAN